MGKFIGIDEILQGGTPNRPTHSTPEEGKKGEALARTSLEYPLELHRKVKKYAVDAGMKEKQVIAQAIRNSSREWRKNKEHKIEENEDIRIFVDGGHGVHDMFLPG